ncbi:MAG: NAD-dependent epimerase/dehydratase family protein [Flavobacterium sp.]|uniref:NAD-dependent epimerase/dehydratase family protein n=1 Tax=Flavobacterium sp. TaxID=239 RepID=UPI003264B183
MIIGNGLIAKTFHDFDNMDTVIFASGVSNSLETDKNSFLREVNLVEQTLEANKKSLFVYFSTCSVYDSSKAASHYVSHKLFIENLIKEKAKKYLILRVSNAVGKQGNPNLLLNYLFKKAIDKDEIVIQKNAKRNLIDVEDLKQITINIINQNIINRTVNLAYLFNFSIIDIVSAIEKFTNQQLQLKFEDSGQEYNIELDLAKEYFLKNNKLNKELYLEYLLDKYYSDYAFKK